MARPTLLLTFSFLFLSISSATAQLKDNLADAWGGENANKVWKLSNAKIIEEPKTGNFLLKISGKGQAYQEIQLPDNAKGVQVKCNIKSIGQTSDGEAAIQITAFGVKGEELTVKKSKAGIIKGNKENLIKNFIKLPENTKSLKLSCSSSFEDGEVFFDDVYLRPTSSAITFFDYSDELPLKEDWELHQSEKNLILTNGGFETGMEGWPDWAGLVTDEISHYGNKCLKVEQITDDPQWIMRRQKIAIPQNAKAIKISGWIKTERVFNTPADWEGARIYVQFIDNTGAEVKVAKDGVGRAVGTTEWRQYTAELAIPEKAVAIWLHCGLANVPGAAWFDDLKVEFVQ